MAMRTDYTVPAAGGRPELAMRKTPAVGAEQAVAVFANGTNGKPEFFDRMADQLAQRGVTTYSTYVESPKDYGRAMQFVASQPHALQTEGMGSSLGADMMLGWLPRHG